MATFYYKAINSAGKRLGGKMTAANDIDLEQRLKEMNADLIYSRELKDKTKNFNLFGVKLKDKIMLCVQLEQLDKAGVPILDSLADVRDSTDSKKLKEIMADVYESVKNGTVLSEALAKHPKTFDSVFVGLVSAGEKTGNLHEAFHTLTHHLKWNAEIKRKVKKATIYPTFMLFVIIGVVSFFMTWVVPQMRSFIESQGQELPGHTKALLATADFFAENTLAVMITPVLLIVGIKTLKKTSSRFAMLWDRIMLKLPILGPPIRKIDIARFTHFFAVLYNSGIDILDCLKVGQQVVKNKVILDSLVTVRRIVSEGNSLTKALSSSNQFPKLVVRMFKVGEESGNMKDALDNVTYFYDKEVNDAIDAIIGTIKPTLTVVLGLILSWIAAGMFGPLYSTIGKMQY